MKKYRTKKELADALSTTEQRIAYLTRTGRISPAFRLGTCDGRYDLDAVVASLAVTAPSGEDEDIDRA